MERGKSGEEGGWRGETRRHLQCDGGECGAQGKGAKCKQQLHRYAGAMWALCAHMLVSVFILGALIFALLFPPALPPSPPARSPSASTHPSAASPSSTPTPTPPSPDSVPRPRSVLRRLRTGSASRASCMEPLLSGSPSGGADPSAGAGSTDIRGQGTTSEGWEMSLAVSAPAEYAVPLALLEREPAGLRWPRGSGGGGGERTGEEMASTPASEDANGSKV